MPLAGEQLTIKEGLALCKVVGFKDQKLVTAVAVMTAESGRWTGAWHDNIGDDGTVVSVDRGLFQINSIHQIPGDPYDPVINATFAAELSQGGENWSAWAAFNSGVYERFVEGVRVVRQENLWQSRTKLWD
jgi:hypothetical protein